MNTDYLNPRVNIIGKTVVLYLGESMFVLNMTLSTESKLLEVYRFSSSKKSLINTNSYYKRSHGFVSSGRVVSPKFLCKHSSSNVT